MLKKYIVKKLIIYPRIQDLYTRRTFRLQWPDQQRSTKKSYKGLSKTHDSERFSQKQMLEKFKFNLRS